MTVDAAMTVARRLTPGTVESIDCPRCKITQGLLLRRFPNGSTEGSCTYCELEFMEG